MKNTLLIIGLLVVSALPVKAQDIFDAQVPVTWLGIDFSKLKFIPADEVISNQDLQDKYFPGWNQLILAEPAKFDIAKAIGRSTVAHHIEVIETVNKKAKPDFIDKDMASWEHLDADKVTQMVRQYDLKGHTGVGLVFIAESMSKSKKEASFWVTFIDMGSREILLSKPVTAEAGGFGFRNYWAGAINKVLKKMPSNMKKWSKE